MLTLARSRLAKHRSFVEPVSWYATHPNRTLEKNFVTFLLALVPGVLVFSFQLLPDLGLGWGVDWQRRRTF